jgi:hypothetical protein
VHLLARWGFVETSTPCLFRHPTRSIAFVLVVDDFGIKYHSRDDYDYLVQCLASMYHVKAHPIATKFLGFTLKHDRQLRTFAIFYPGYADALLTRLRPEGVKPCDTPSVYTPPRFGSTAPQVPTADTEPPASAAQRKDLEVAIGYLLYYGRLVDSRILPATCALASEQSIATLGTVKRLNLNRLLGFVSTHRDTASSTPPICSSPFFLTPRIICLALALGA